MEQLEQKMQEFFLGNLPGMSVAAKENTVKFLPLAIIGFNVLAALIMVFGGLMAPIIGFGAMVTGGIFLVMKLMISFIIGVAIVAANIYGGLLMKKRKLTGWRVVLYVSLLSTINCIINLSVIGILIDVIIFYLLFQTKEYYA